MHLREIKRRREIVLFHTVSDYTVHNYWYSVSVCRYIRMCAGTYICEQVHTYVCRYIHMCTYVCVKYKNFDNNPLFILIYVPYTFTNVRTRVYVRKQSNHTFILTCLHCLPVHVQEEIFCLEMTQMAIYRPIRSHRNAVTAYISSFSASWT
jgi:hypothetical protein